MEVDAVAARALEGALAASVAVALEGALKATVDLEEVLHAAAAAAKEAEAETELGTGTEVLLEALARPEFLCPVCRHQRLPTTRLSTTDWGQTWTTSQLYSWRQGRP